MSEKAAQERTSDASADLDTVHDMIQMAYRVAVEPELFDDLIATWDRFIASVSDADQAEVLRGHFEQAERIVNDPRLDRTRNLDAILKLIAAPAILADEGGALVSANEAGRRVIGLPDNANVATVLGDEWRPPGPEDTHYFRAVMQGRPLMAASTFVPVSQDGARVLLIRLEASEWRPQIETTLKETYGLTPTEVETTRLLHAGQSLAEIAALRNRSAETVRSQLKSVLRKTGLQRQAALLQLLSRLQYVLGEARDDPAPPAVVATANTGAEQRALSDPNGRRITYSVYGAPHGRSVLYLTTSSRPAETEAWREAVHKAGLRVIAPSRPGFGGSDPSPGHAAPEDAIWSDCRQILQHEQVGPLALAGHREGGILAAQICAPLAKVFELAGLCMISTGAPQSDFAISGRSETAMQRSVTAVRMFPHALRLGYRAAKRVFEMGPRGEAEIVSYFFKSSPLDSQLIRDNDYWEITRANIAYSFERPDTIVDDIGLWASDWAPDWLKAQDGSVDAGRLDRLPVISLLGSAHEFLDAARLQVFCDQRPFSSAETVGNTAQLMLYQRPDLVAKRIAGLFASPAA